MLDENNNTTLHNGRSYHPFNHIFNIINHLRIKKQNLWHDPREEVNSLIRHHASIAPIFVTRANPPGLVLKVTRSQSLPEVGEKPNRRPSSTLPYASLVVVFPCSESNRVCVCVAMEIFPTGSRGIVRTWHSFHAGNTGGRLLRPVTRPQVELAVPRSSSVAKYLNARHKRLTVLFDNA